MQLDGGAEGSRTPDLLIANETLYQLSYDPIQQERRQVSAGRQLLWNIIGRTQSKNFNFREIAPNPPAVEIRRWPQPNPSGLD